MKNKTPLHESLALGLILSFVGGYFDAYTYLLRDGRFATMETGNMILSVYRFVVGEVGDGFLYLLPVASFFLTVFFVDLIETHLMKRQFYGYHEWFLLGECLFVLGSAFIPLGEFNICSTCLLAVASGIQLEVFRALLGVPYASNMCTGNLQKGARYLALSTSGEGLDKLLKGLCFLLIVLSFCLGCAVSLLLCKIFYAYSILFGLFPLFGAIAYLYIGRRIALTA